MTERFNVAVGLNMRVALGSVRRRQLARLNALCDETRFWLPASVAPATRFAENYNGTRFYSDSPTRHPSSFDQCSYL
jgi:hypothetical protein